MPLERGNLPEFGIREDGGKLASANALIYGSTAQPFARPSMAAEAPEPIAVVSDYGGLIEALRRRVIELNTTLTALDHLSGLAEFHSSKIFGQKKKLGRMSFDALLGALAIKLIVVSDPDQLRKIRHRLPPRGPWGPKPGAVFSRKPGPRRRAG
jgi:hypothetical protein